MSLDVMTQASRVLLADDDPLSRDFLGEALAGAGCQVTRVDDGAAAIKQIERREFDLVVTDLKMPRKDGLEVLRAVRSKGARTPVVIVTAFGTVEIAIEALRAGADDILVKPVELAQLELLLARVGKRSMLLAENEYLRESTGGGDALFTSDAMRSLLDVVDKVAASSATVLVTGESGTGKEVIAAELHRRSRRAAMPFIKVNCAAIPDTLMESEFFGHEAGAFTGATARKLGKFELANGGTLMLDEIGEIATGLQSKLLRVIEDGIVQRVGGNDRVQVDVRLIAATNQDLAAAVAHGSFREDLFYRLNIVPIAIPPLRERTDDILPLARSFLEQDARERGRGALELAPDAERLLLAYEWPGNVRELRNLIQRVVLLASSSTIEAADLSQWISRRREPASVAPDPLRSLVGSTLREIEQRVIRATLDHVGGNRTKAAQLLGVSARTLYNRLGARDRDPC